MVPKLTISVVLAIFLITVVQAQAVNNSYFWETYGGDYNPLQMSQFITASSNWNATNVQTASTANGYSPALSSWLTFYGSATPMQPMVSHMGSNRNGYFVIPNGNYLQVYDSNRQLKNEIVTGAVTGQIDMGDFNGDGLVNDIAGTWGTNTTDVSYRIYNFNYSTNVLTLYRETNLSLGAQGTQVNSSGVRCEVTSVAQCHSIAWSYNGSRYMNNYVRFYANGTITSVNLTTTYTPMSEPLAWTDADNDGTIEYLTWAYDKAILFTDTGTIERTFSSSFAGGSSMNDGYRGARFAKVDGTPQYRVAIAEKTTATCGTGQYNCAYLKVYKMDGSLLWQNQFSGVTSGDFMDLSNLAIGDYNNDGYEDIYVTEKRTVNNLYAKFRAFKGSDGSSLLNKDMTSYVSTLRGDNSHMMLARMDADNSLDIIGIGGGTVTVYSPALDAQLLQGTGTGCAVADLTYDSTLELVCTNPTTTYVYSTNFTNVNAVLHSLAFSPSLSVAVNSPLSIVYNATDTEGNSIFYSGECGDGVNLTETGSNVKSCTYSSVGSYTFTGRVRDGYHSEYSSGTATITVTQTGAVCNANSVCEAGIGETYANCPSDCSASSNGSIVTGSNGKSIEGELVNVDNENEGLLPSIYYSILAGLSYAWVPAVGIAAVLILALIVLAIFGFFKNVVGRFK